MQPRSCSQARSSTLRNAIGLLARRSAPKVSSEASGAPRHLCLRCARAVASAMHGFTDRCSSTLSRTPVRAVGAPATRFNAHGGYAPEGASALEK